jgi:hypothetical protein
MPDAATRARIIAEITERLEDEPFDPGEEVIAATDGMSGRDLEELLSTVKLELDGGPLAAGVLLEFLGRRRAAVAELGDVDLEDGLLLQSPCVASAYDLARTVARARSMPLIEVVSTDQVLPYEAAVLFFDDVSDLGENLEMRAPGQGIIAVTPDLGAVGEELRARFAASLELGPLVPLAADAPPDDEEEPPLAQTA